MKKIGLLFLASILGGAFSLGVFKWFENKSVLPTSKNNWNGIMTFPTAFSNNYKNTQSIDFVDISEKSVHAVVHVKNVSLEKSNPNSFFDFLYGSGQNKRIRVGTGSGVIISKDGLIVTNNHVIKDATELEVILNNNKSYKAEVVGKDPTTDIALLKIKSDESLPFLVFGDSDQVKVGQWALAVGNPFNLTSTVTAGIISAKSRDLNPYDYKNQSFIQTDAAVNPGNSGGALVNDQGHLIGINTAISSETGNYVGYSFAVPSNIVKKVVEDLIEYGNIQKGILGVAGIELNASAAKKLKIDQTNGYYIAKVEEDSGAKKAGIKEGDIIIKIDNTDIVKFSDISGYLFTKRPNEIVMVTLLRNSKKKIVRVKLLKNETYKVPQLGITVKNLSKSDIKKYNTSEGVKITSTDRNMEGYKLEGKVLIQINDKLIDNIDDVKKTLSKNSYYGRTLLVLLNKQGEKERFIFQ